MVNEFCILQVEDDENDVFFLEHAFRTVELNYPLRVAQDGQEAMDYLSGKGRFADRARYPLPRLVLLDLKMPRKNGFEVLEWIRENPEFQFLPVIVFSSSYQPNDIDRAYQLGANAFVVKPSCLETRIDLARCIKSFWLNFNQQPACFSEKSDRAQMCA